MIARARHEPLLTGSILRSPRMAVYTFNGMTVQQSPPPKVKKGVFEKLPEWVVRGCVVVAGISAPTALILAARDLVALEGPGWAKVLAWAGSILVFVALAAVYVEQYRHLDAMSSLHTNHADELARYKRNSAVAIALPSVHDAYHLLRDAAVMIRANEHRPCVPSGVVAVAWAHGRGVQRNYWRPLPDVREGADRFRRCASHGGGD